MTRLAIIDENGNIKTTFDDVVWYSVYDKESVVDYLNNSTDLDWNTLDEEQQHYFLRGIERYLGDNDTVDGYELADAIRSVAADLEIEL